MTTDPDCLEGPGRTREEMAADARALDAIAPTPADKFALMFGRNGFYRREAEIARYWHDAAECVCSDPSPIGACLKCDMGFVLRTLDPESRIP